ncbi:sporulation integral membrane protein YtvI [Caldalkalibacillus uzonensis]|uniref:Sporulation integral membrane protein YtvI n=1 Tax=Caldalkalibacillus uzonensis TaxID=353224 RepID=A0ABU0CV71_9BACI|nr:sporulation integral membrane protein YtvI [Caldalkalibacillus uzonensis]MDQ0340314.1 sporulation integral membrane protein YtvI [Caldalkalibacillus uzonensis]
MSAERRAALKEIITPKRIIIACVLLISGFILYRYLSVFMPLILAFVTALLLEPLVKLAQRTLYLKHRLAAVTLVFILFVCFIGLMFYLGITKLVNEAMKFIDRLPYYIIEVTFFVENAIEQFNETIATLPQPLVEEIERQSFVIISKANQISAQAISAAAGWVQAIPNLIVVILIYLIALFLISKELPRYIEAFYTMFKEENAEKVRYMFQRLSRVFTGFFKAQFLVSIIIFIVSYVGLLLISPRNALLMAVIIWIIDFIPIIGSIVILAPWGLFNLITGDTHTGIQLLILAMVLLTIRRTVEPKVMGDQIGLPPLPTLIGIYLGFYFLGVIGLIAGPLLIIAFLSAKEAGIIRFNFKI